MMLRRTCWGKGGGCLGEEEAPSAEIVYKQITFIVNIKKKQIRLFFSHKAKPTKTAKYTHETYRQEKEISH